ncbi:MAG: hypothetical protein HY243_12395 [Proteobacteria bacterium]|nr:hypothetical protein [Pseudomonadota bacterium]
MAIKNKQDINGLNVPAAYTRVIRIFGGKEEGWNAFVGVYASADARETGLAPLTTFNVRAPYVSDQNPFTAVYAEISKLPEYTSAQNV